MGKAAPVVPIETALEDRVRQVGSLVHVLLTLAGHIRFGVKLENSCISL